MRMPNRFAYAAVSSLALTAPAFAQDSGEDAALAVAAAEGRDPNQIVVTGTLIRGTAVTGSQTISVDAEEIAAKGATSTNELLGLIP